jgi:hypothetical protein
MNTVAVELTEADADVPEPEPLLAPDVPTPSVTPPAMLRRSTRARHPPDRFSP